MKVITRFAPSPTGFLHVGNVRTALVNWLFTRSFNGQFILRIDDTDRLRSSQEYEDAIKQDLHWLGLDWDKIFIQSHRMDKYEVAKQKLIDDGRLYPCYETQEELEFKKKTLLSRNLPPIYDRAALKLTKEQKLALENQGLKPHWRFFIEDEPITWYDAIKGEMNFVPRAISDPVLIRADGTMTYTIASIVDDIEFGITNIIRGEDHLSNSAIHRQIFEALGAKAPEFAHLALLISRDGEISKRVGGFDICALRNAGIEPMTINSFLSKIGTADSVTPHQTLQELLDGFSISKFSKSASHYDQTELERLNSKLIRTMPYEIARARIKELGLDEVSHAFWEVVRNNIDRIDEISIWSEICNTHLKPQEYACEISKKAASVLPKEPWDDDIWEDWINAVKAITDKTGKEIFIPIRRSLTGLTSGPELKTILMLLGYDEVLKRLNGLEK